MKKYKITFISTWGDEVFIHMKAENKTFARRRFRGEMNPKCKIIKIEEVCD